MKKAKSASWSQSHFPHGRLLIVFVDDVVEDHIFFTGGFVSAILQFLNEFVDLFFGQFAGYLFAQLFAFVCCTEQGDASGSSCTSYEC